MGLIEIYFKSEFIEKMLPGQNMLKKDVLNLKEAAIHTEGSHSHQYKRANELKIPACKPNGKNLCFNCYELNSWLLSNRQASSAGRQEQTQQYQPKKGRRQPWMK